MHDSYWWFSLVAGVVSVSAYIPLVIEWKKGWKPHRATWFIWVFVTFALTASMIAAGARETAIIPAAYFVGSCLIASLSYKNGVGGWETLDKWCILVAVIAMSLWLITGNPLTALFLLILCDASAAIPTGLKLWKDPKSESRLGWSLFCAGAIMSIFAAKHFTFTEVGYPIFVTFFTAGVVSLTFRKNAKN